VEHDAATAGLQSGTPLALRLAVMLASVLLALSVSAGETPPGSELPPAPRVPAGAFAEAAFDGEEDRAAVRLLIDRERVRPGDSLRVGVLFDLDPGWHIYWKSPGDSGLPTELRWDAAQAEIGPIQWTTPHTFSEGDGLITTYGYSDRVLLYADARVAEDARDPLRIEVTAHFLACDITCIPGEVKLARELRIGGESTPAASHVVALFDAAAAARPTPLAALGLEAQVLYSQSAIRPGDEFEAAIALGCQGRADCTPPRLAEDALGYAFIPDLIDGMQLEVTGSRPHPLSPGDVLIELHGRAGAAPPEAPQRLGGTVGLWSATGGAAIAAALDLPLPRAAAGADVAMIGTPWRESGRPELATDATATAATSGGLPLGRALLLALLGGLILNLMPCVLPILAIKVFAMTDLAHSDRRNARAHGAAYGAGVVGSMLVLAAAVVALRAGGESVGWGFQFQQPVFVAGISAVLVVFALNLFGSFEIFVPTGGLAEVGSHAAGPRRSFFEGLLAVVLATPCSAPFLGTAVGFAFAGSPSTIFMIFAAIGTGLAAPFVLVTLHPGWARFIPRAGPWMNSLRAGLGFAVLATVVWLVWVVGRLVGIDGVGVLLAFLIAVAFAAWVFGQLQASGRTLPARSVAIAALVAGCVALSALPFDATSAAATREPEPGDAIRWSPDGIRSALAQDRPAFVYFTADWCITCKVNEHSTLASDAVIAAFDEHGVRVFKGDWTRRDTAIADELARFGKGGVPMYLVYAPDAPDDPQLLPELLTPGLVVEAVRKAAPGG